MSAEKVVTKRKAAEKEGRPSKKVKSNEKPNKLKAATEAKKSRKRAADFIEEEVEETVPKKATKAKKVRIAEVEETVPKKVAKTKKVSAAEVEEPIPTSISQAKSKSKSADKKKSSKGKKEEKAVVVAEEVIPDEGSSDGEEDVAALLAGFSSDDEQEDETEGIPLDQVPQAKIDKKAKKALADAKKNGQDTPGTLYIGRVPHGFYEHQMKAYFTQFGDITRLRLSRNKKTGASKHYAFVEFSSGEVADIVARTMDNYLMFGHILKVRRIPDEQIHPDLWKNEGKRFKRIPWAKIEGGRLKQPKGREYWRVKETREKEKREKKMEVLKEYGYEFAMPEIKSVDDVPMKGAPVEVVKETVVETETPKAIAAGSAEVDGVQVEVEKVLKKGSEKKKVKTKVTKKKAVKA